MNNRKPKSGVRAAALQNDKRIRASAGVSLASWTAAASGARRRFGKRSHPDSPCESAVVAALCQRSPNVSTLALQPGLAVWEAFHDPKDGKVKLDGENVVTFLKLQEFQQVTLEVLRWEERENGSSSKRPRWWPRNTVKGRVRRRSRRPPPLNLV